MNIILASSNKHKQEEIASYFSNHSILLPNDLDIQFYCDEDQDSFIGNAVKKAKTLSQLVNNVVLADDSGLVVPKLGGRPGIYSARYGELELGKKLNSVEKNRLLLEELGNTDERDAYFVCCLVYYECDHKITIIEERCNGKIVESYNENILGFGYDPIFIPENNSKVMALLDTHQKNTISHRGLALAKLHKILNN